MDFLGNINSLYALIGVFLMLLFKVWSKSREDRKYRDERISNENKDREIKNELEKQKIANAKARHEEIMAQTQITIELQKKQTEAIIESLNRNNEITDLHTENIIDIAETIDQKHKTKKAELYRQKYNFAEKRHQKKKKLN